MHLRLVLFAPVILLTGCGSGEKIPAAHPVTGVVTFEGKPLEGADVVLVPGDTTKKSAGAVTDADGKFSVKTYWNAENQLEGAFPGDYGITVTKLEKRDVPADMKPEEVMAMHMKLGAPKQMLPKKYGVPATSGFKVTVGESSPEPLQLDLK